MTDNTHTREFLRKIPLFSILNETELDAVEQNASVEFLDKYGYAYQLGEDARKVYFLKSGCIKIGTHSNDGKEVIKSVLYPTAMFGELGLVGEGNRIDFAQSMNQDTELLAINVSTIKNLMVRNHGMSIKLFELIGSRLVFAERRLEAMMIKDARARIVDFIKDAASKNGQRVGYEMLVRHSLTQQDIANLTGTSRQTVTSVMNDLKKSNLIYFNRRSILVRDMQKLA